MNRIVRILLCSILLFLMCGCKETYHDLTTSGQTDILSGSPVVSLAENAINISCERKEAAVISFQEDGLIPDTFYEVSADIRVNGGIYAAIGGGSEDINGESVVGKAQQDTAARIVKTDSDGKCRFRIFAGKPDENHKGNITVCHVSVRPAAETNTYVLYKSSDNTVRILFRKNDVQKSGIKDNQITEWLNILSDFRREADKISAYGLPEISICASETFSHYGLSGNPIYICRDYIPEQLKCVAATIDKSPQERDILWRFIHEICHAADGFGYGTIAPRVFDSEFSAQLECAYLMTKLGFRYDGQKSASEYFSACIPLEQMIFSDEGFLYRLLTVIERTDPELKSIEKALLSCQYRTDMAEGEKLTVFFDEISACLGFDIKTKFSQKELQVIEQKYHFEKYAPC